ncbi:MAG: alkylhydroperoxidase [Planctomycetaceae bacterium]|nr:alkylhydroperoxidase [Planctomycetaceae bacterium]
MAKLVSDAQAKGRVKEIFDDIGRTFGVVPNFFRALAASDLDSLAVNWSRWQAVMGQPGPLDRKTKELLAVAVSSANNSKYCTSAHEAMARMVGATDEQLAETHRVIELFVAFNRIADELEVPCDSFLDPASGG